jgi:Transposase DDE domain
MYIDIVPNRNSPPAVLLRESYREGGKVKKRTIANLSKLPMDVIDQLRILLHGGHAVESFEGSIEVLRSLPHGHVAAVLGTLIKTGLDHIISSEKSRELSLILAMIVARIIEPQSKLATARGLDPETASSSLGEVLGLGRVTENDLYFAMDWLSGEQERIENTLAAKHLQGGALVLYDITSTYFAGRTCPLAQLGYSRDGKSDKLQIVIGLLCAPDGCPVAVEVFEGNTADSSTVESQVKKVQERFGIERVVLVGDRGMITETRLRKGLRDTEGLDWITALRAPQISKLVASGGIQLGVFDKRDMAEITHPDYPDERLIVCRNPVLALDRVRTREALLQRTERELEKVKLATSRPKRRLKGKEQIGLRVGKVIGKFKMAKHFVITIEEESFSSERDLASIAEEAALDGIHVLRTSVPKEVLDTNETVGAYKSLSQVERAFRSLKSIDLKIRPIHHRLAERVKAHVFLCMLAYYVEWHMRQVLAPILFDDHNPADAAKIRPNMVVPAERSKAAKRKAAAKVTDDGLPVHSFQTLLSDLATIARNTVEVKPTNKEPVTFEKVTQPTLLQRRALDLLGVRLIA